MNSMILQSADHLQPGAVADMREAWIFVTAEMSLQNSAILRSVENGAPRLQLPHAIRCFFRVQLGHAPLVHILTAAHCIGEMHLPVVALIDIGQSRTRKK